MSRAKVFKAGAAIAPLTDCRNYDTIWTERYMGLLKDNLAGYTAADPCTYADGLNGGTLLLSSSRPFFSIPLTHPAFLIVHGTGDDNVHPQNTIMYINKLISKSKQFELMLYPNRNHGLSGADSQRHFWTMLTNFFRRHLAF